MLLNYIELERSSPSFVNVDILSTSEHLSLAQITGYLTFQWHCYTCTIYTSRTYFLSFTVTNRSHTCLTSTIYCVLSLLHVIHTLGDFHLQSNCTREDEGRDNKQEASAHTQSIDEARRLSQSAYRLVNGIDDFLFSDGFPRQQ